MEDCVNNVGVDLGVKTLATLSNGEVFNNLKPNEQDAIIYHAYKCGFGGFTKFQIYNSFTELITHDKRDILNVADKTLLLSEMLNVSIN